jgi:hypothetical protein
MKAEMFYAKVLAISNQPAERRVKGMNHLHLECMDAYLKAIDRIDDARAAEASQDGRSILQIVAHIYEWERYVTLALGEITAGVLEPQIMHLKGFIEPDGKICSFKNVDDFNAYQAAKYKNTSWSAVKPMAVRMTLALQAIFSQPVILPYELLEKTSPYRWRLAGGSLISLPVAWYLWISSLEHQVVEHAVDLKIE